MAIIVGVKQNVQMTADPNADQAGYEAVSPEAADARLEALQPGADLKAKR
jgi:hypothetical protein